jgi:hypothetical protein
MNSLVLPLEILQREGQRTIDVPISDQMLDSWCLGLCLLHFEIIECLGIRNQKGMQIRICINTDLSEYHPGTVTWQEREALVEVSRSNILTWIIFYLEYYRDGVSPVDHMDIELPCREPGGDRLFLILKVSKTSPPLSPEEAAKNLGIDWP